MYLGGLLSPLNTPMSMLCKLNSTSEVPSYSNIEVSFLFISSGYSSMDTYCTP